MKILHVISSFPPAYAYGGALKTAYEISRHLVNRGHEVTVYTTDVLDSWSRFKYEKNPIWLDGIKICYFRNINNGLAYKNFPIAPNMAVALDKNVKKFDLIHLHEYRSFQAYVTWKYAKKYDIPYLIQPHGSTVNLMGKSLMKKLFDKLIGFNILKDASKIIALTEVEALNISRFNIDKKNIEIIPNGIDVSKFPKFHQKGQFRKKHNISNNESVILFLGRLHKIKGIDLLLKSFAGLSGNLKLVIAGPDGGYLSTIKKIIEKLDISEKVLLVGPLYGSEKYSAYNDSDIFVLPSVYETFPNTVLEACAFGLPIIITENCGIANIVNNNIGIVVNYDSIQLKNAIIKILENKRLRNVFMENGKKMIRNQFNWNKILNQLEEIYESNRLNLL